jgi:multiple sugar transport system permease protein/putative aldouronate transport system permease protein
MSIFNKNKNKVKQGFSDDAFNTILVIIATIILVLVLYPIIYIVSSSFSSGNAVTSGRVLLWPVQFCVDGYEIVFQNSAVWSGYANTIMYTLLGSALHLIMTILIAYPLSRRNYQARNLLTTIFMVPMFFGGGLIPTYILVSNLGLVDTRLWMVITGAVGTSHIIIMRTFFQSSIPNDLLESAKLDGITDIGYLLKIVIPLSKASISVILLYAMVDKWNSYFTPMLYLTDRGKYPLQLILREILSASQIDTSTFSDSAAIAKLASAYDTMKYALIVVSTVPMLVLYPFVQKFFEKGVMMGSIKG